MFNMRSDAPAITYKFLIIQNMSDYIPYIIYLLRALCFSIAICTESNHKCVRKVLRCTQGQKYTNINLQYVYTSALQIKLIYKGHYRWLKYEKYNKENENNNVLDQFEDNKTMNVRAYFKYLCKIQASKVVIFSYTCLNKRLYDQSKTVSCINVAVVHEEPV